MLQAKEVEDNVAHLPLSPEARAKFNETAAVEYFKSINGLPYGSYNFLFGWIDTPYDNMPPLIPPGLLPILLAIYEDYNPESADLTFA